MIVGKRCLSQRVWLIELLAEHLASDLYTLITGSLGNFVVGRGDMGGVKDITHMLDHSDVVLGPWNPSRTFRIKEPFMHGTVGDWHT
jgi:hypothetical protein